MPNLPKALLAMRDWRRQLENDITDRLKELLETKHLYQSTAVSFNVLAQKVFPTEAILKATKDDWIIRDTASAPSVHKSAYVIIVIVPDVKLFCQQCDRREAFNSVSGQATVSEVNIQSRSALAEAIQVFVLRYQCQACKSFPEVFIVRRQGLKLTLCGRAPMEVAKAPRKIPKIIQKYYSGALVAHQSGQTLAGLFLLRTLIEQWTRSRIATPARADELLDNYMKTLPDDFKGRFPSMRVLYDDISADLHTATGSPDLFDRAVAEITGHFSARDLFRLH